MHHLFTSKVFTRTERKRHTPYVSKCNREREWEARRLLGEWMLNPSRPQLTPHYKESISTNSIYRLQGEDRGGNWFDLVCLVFSCASCKWKMFMYLLQWLASTSCFSFDIKFIIKFASCQPVLLIDVIYLCIWFDKF
jgi:hypothetical protein